MGNNRIGMEGTDMLTKEERRKVERLAIDLSSCEFFLGSLLAAGMDASSETKDRVAALAALTRYLDQITES